MRELSSLRELMTRCCNSASRLPHYFSTSFRFQLEPSFENNARARGKPERQHADAMAIAEN